MIFKKEIEDVAEWAKRNARATAECNNLPEETEHLLETAYCDAYGQIISSEKTEGLTFSEALESLKEGKRVTRQGWNGKGMFIFLFSAKKENIKTVVNNESLPIVIRNYYRQDILDEQGNELPTEKVADNDVVSFTSYLCMKAADGTIVNGWLASQTDLLSEDWFVLD